MSAIFSVTSSPRKTTEESPPKNKEELLEKSIRDAAISETVQTKLKEKVPGWIETYTPTIVMSAGYAAKAKISTAVATAAAKTTALGAALSTKTAAMGTTLSTNATTLAVAAKAAVFAHPVIATVCVVVVIGGVAYKCYYSGSSQVTTQQMQDLANKMKADAASLKKEGENLTEIVIAIDDAALRTTTTQQSTETAVENEIQKIQDCSRAVKDLSDKLEETADRTQQAKLKKDLEIEQIQKLHDEIRELHKKREDVELKILSTSKENNVIQTSLRSRIAEAKRLLMENNSLKQELAQ